MVYNYQLLLQQVVNNQPGYNVTNQKSYSADCQGQANLYINQSNTSQNLNQIFMNNVRQQSINQSVQSNQVAVYDISFGQQFSFK